MRKLLPEVRRPVRSIVVTATVAAAALAGTQAPSMAAPMSTTRGAVQQEFDGFGIGRSAFIALRNARNAAARQATAAGFDPKTCSTGFEDSGWDPGLNTFFGESDLFC